MTASQSAFLGLLEEINEFALSSRVLVTEILKNLCFEDRKYIVLFVVGLDFID